MRVLLHAVAHRSDVGGVNCDDPTLNPEGCSYIMPNASYAAKVGLKRTSPALMRKIRAGYAGGITWTDMQIGKVLDALEETGEKDNTLVMWWADHGWALGEQSMFCKMANFELQTRVPFMIRAPWLTSAVGSTTAMVELVDMYPTAVELTGLGARVDISRQGPLGLEGYSIAPLLSDSRLHESQPAAWKRAAFSQYPRCMNSTAGLANPPYLATGDPCVGHTANMVTHMGYSMRTAKWSNACVTNYSPRPFHPHVLFGGAVSLTRCTNTLPYKDRNMLEMLFNLSSCASIPVNGSRRYAEWPKWVCHGTAGDTSRCSTNMNTTGAVWSGAADWQHIAGVELYAHTGDAGDCFDCFENENLACVQTTHCHIAPFFSKWRKIWI